MARESRVWTGAVVVLALAVVSGVAALVPVRPAWAEPLPGAPYALAPVINDLDQPVAVRVGDNGQVFVAETSGVIKGYSSISDPTPTITVDLQEEVHRVGDRGMYGFELHPDYPAQPYAWVLYPRNEWPRGSGIGRYQSNRDTWHLGDDACPSAVDDGCPVYGELVRLRINSGSQQVVQRATLISGEWCAQNPSHGTAGVVFGTDGALYVGAGEGANWTRPDWGQFGNPRNPCGDPPGGVGGSMTMPEAEGGSFRSLDLLTPGDPVGYAGGIIRIDPMTGAALPDNPRAGGDPGDDRVVAIGLRNPYRFAQDPTGKLWIGDVGQDTWEEITSQMGTDLVNHGWPCYEGMERATKWGDEKPTLCERLYDGEFDADGLGHRSPDLAIRHGRVIQQSPPESTPPVCGIASVISSMTWFDEGTALPREYEGSLLWADAFSGCAYATRVNPKTGELMPDTTTVIANGLQVVDIEVTSNAIYFVHVGRLHPGSRTAGKVYALQRDGTLPCRTFDYPGEPRDDPFEQNDTRSSAADFQGGGYLNLWLCGRDHDWYRFEARAGQTASVLVDAKRWFHSPEHPLDSGFRLEIRGPAPDYTLLATHHQPSELGPEYLHVDAEAQRSGTHYLHLVIDDPPSAPIVDLYYGVEIHVCSNDRLGNSVPQHAVDRVQVPPYELRDNRIARAVSCPREIDTYVFAAVQGEQVSLVTETAPSIEGSGPSFLLYSSPRYQRPPLEEPLELDMVVPPVEGSTEQRVVFRAPYSGRYYAEVQNLAWSTWPYAIAKNFGSRSLFGPTRLCAAIPPSITGTSPAARINNLLRSALLRSCARLEQLFQPFRVPNPPPRLAPAPGFPPRP